MTVVWCEKCGGPMFIPPIGKPHKCPPRWEVWCLDYDGSREDAAHVYASCAEQAATKWAERDDAEGDYCIISGSEVTVCVARSREVRMFKVTGVTEPVYKAEEIELNPADNEAESGGIRRSIRRNKAEESEDE